MSNAELPERQLLPCPYCPYPTSRYFADRNVGWQEDKETDRRRVVVCAQCGAQGPAFGVMSFNNDSTAAQYWNTRSDLVSRDTAPRSVVNLEAWTSIDSWLRQNPNATAAECLTELVRRIKVEVGSAPAPSEAGGAKWADVPPEDDVLVLLAGQRYPTPEKGFGSWTEALHALKRFVQERCPATVSEAGAVAAAREIVGPMSGRDECPSCLAHPHRDACGYNCRLARGHKERIKDVAAIISKYCGLATPADPSAGPEQPK